MAKATESKEFRVVLIKGKKEFICDETDVSLYAAINRAVTDLTEHPEIGPGPNGKLEEPFPRAEVLLGKSVIAVVELKSFTSQQITDAVIAHGNEISEIYGAVFKVTRNT